MKNISLIKVTFAVVVTALGSSLVSATDVVPEIAPALAISTIINIQFKRLDVNKDSLLSLLETQNSKLILIAFTKID
jgi:hypothetical protein